MKRKIYDHLLLWKNKRKGKSALMIEGARRVGKSYIVREFAQREYKSYILIDFFKVGDDIKDLFKNYKDNLDMLFTYPSTYFSTRLYPRESIIVFDEIEFCPAAHASIKYLVEDGRYDYLETGSLLGMKTSTQMRKKDKDKYATKVNSIYEAIPAQLQLHDHKFQLADLDKNARFRNYASAFFWLRDAKMVNLAFNTTEPSIGLGLKQKDNSLKCYMNDTGLMISHAFNERGIVSEQLYQKILKDKLEINAGMLMENIVAQMLVANDCKLFFYSNSSRENKDDRMEIDFLIVKSTITSRHNISPIEVKSSTGFSTVSMEKCLKKYSTHLSQAYIVHTGDVERDGDYLYIPLYMVPCL